MTWLLQVCEGRAYHVMVRAAELVLALSRATAVQVTFEKDDCYSPWRHLLSGLEQLALRRLEAAPGGPGVFTQDLDLQSIQAMRGAPTSEDSAVVTAALEDMAQRATQHVCLRSGASVPSRPRAGMRLVLLDGVERAAAADTRHYEQPRGFAPFGTLFDTMPGTMPDTFVALPAAVHKDIFTSQHKHQPGHVLLIGQGDVAADCQLTARLLAAGAQAVSLFDPYRGRTDYLAAGLTAGPGESVHYIDAREAEARAASFAPCSAVLVAAPVTHVDNHFFWEAVSAGVVPLGMYLPPPSPADPAGTRWTDALLRDVLARHARGEPTRAVPPIADWRDIVALFRHGAKPTPKASASASESYQFGPHCVRHFDTPEAAQGVALLPDARPVAMLCVGGDAAWSSALEGLLRRYKKIYVDTSDNPMLYVEVVTALFHLELEAITATLPVLQALLQTSQAVQIDVIHVGDTMVHVQGQRSILAGLKGRAGTLGTVTAPAPTILVNHGKQFNSMSGGSRRRIGIGVATDNLQHGIAQDADGRFNVLWAARAGSQSEHGRLHFYPFEPRVGLDRDEVDPPSLPVLLARGDIDLICNLDPVLSASLAARALWATRAVPVVCMLHSLHASHLITEYTNQLLGGALYPFDTVISPSHCGAVAYRHQLDALGAWLATRMKTPPQNTARVEVIPYGIETALYQDLHQLSCRQALSIDAGAIVILAMGRLSKQEKADVLPLLLAVKALRERGRDVKLVLAGGTGSGAEDYGAAITEMLSTLDLIDHVALHRNVSAFNKVLFYGAADIFVAASDNIQETFGMTLLEAMAAGLPVVAAEWDGYREIVRHGETGLLVPTYWTEIPRVGDHVHRIAEGIGGYGHRDLHESVVVDCDALVQHLDALVTNPDLRHALGEKGRAICVADYDQVKQGRKMGDLFLQQIARAKDHPWENARTPFIDSVGERFAHYARHQLDDGMGVTLGAQGQSPARVERMSVLMALAGKREPKIVEAFLSQLVPGRTLRVGALIAHVMQQFPELSRQAIGMRLLRCSKYGLLTITPGPA